MGIGGASGGSGEGIKSMPSSKIGPGCRRQELVSLHRVKALFKKSPVKCVSHCAPSRFSIASSICWALQRAGLNQSDAMRNPQEEKKEGM